MTEIFSSIEPEGYFWRPVLTDVATGAVSVIVIAMAALAIGGFSFFAPWLIVTPVAMFMAGFLRATSFGKIWPKAVAINLPILLLLLVSFRGTTVLNTAATILATESAAVLCTGGGIRFSRRDQQWSRHDDSGVKRRSLLALWFVASVIAALWTLLWLFAFLSGMIYEGALVDSVIRLLLAVVGGLLGWRFVAAFREAKGSGAPQ